jgi:hypothetical protein
MPATWPTNLDQPQVYYQEHKLWCSSLYAFLHSAVTSCLSGANILLTSCSRAPVIYHKCWILTGTGSLPSLLITRSYPLLLMIIYTFHVWNIQNCPWHTVRLCIVAWSLAQTCDKWTVFAFQNGEITFVCHNEQNAISADKRRARDSLLFPDALSS